jgi:ATP-dependent Lon protease
MSATQASSRFLPPNPSEEYLRKQAKRLAHRDAIQLAAAQSQLAHEYGYRNWAKLMTAVQRMALASGAGSTDNPSRPPGSRLINESHANVFPFLPLRGLVTFPHVSYPIFVGRPTSIEAVQFAKEQWVPLVLAAQKDPVKLRPSSSDMYQVGTLARVIQAMRFPDGTIKIVIEANARVRVNRFIFDDDFLKAEVEKIEETAISDARIESLVPLVISALVSRRAKTFGEDNPEAWAVAATTADGASMLADRIASELQMELSSKQALLELLNPADRLEKLLACLNATS